MPKPTEQQLQIINSKFSQTPLTEDNCFVFSNLMIDNLPTMYYSIIQPALLNTFLEDVKKGISLLLVHNNRKLPIGRSFDARVESEYVPEAGREVLTLYGDFYVPLGIAIEGGITTDDVVKGIETGINFATSIGFNAEEWKCSICENDIRDYFACPHIPGRKYAVERNGKDVVETCYVLVGGNGEGELLEDSLVYAGACNRAGVIRNFSANVTDFKDSSKLQVIDDIKNVPMESVITQYYTKDGSVLFTDKPERTCGTEYLRKRSEDQAMLEKVIEVLGKFDIKFADESELETVLSEIFSLKESTANKLEEAKSEITALTEKLGEANEELAQKDSIINELTEKNEELSEKAELAETYRKDLINQALEAGIRAQGNSFPSEMFEKFLGTLSVDELKEVIKNFNEGFAAKFDGVGFARSMEDSDSKANKKFTRDDFETEAEFRDFIADKAVEYASENKVSLVEATKLMYEKYSKGSEE